MIDEAINKVAKKVNLTESETREVFEEIMSGKAAPEEIARFLKALREKGETVEEITGAAKVMREKSLKVNIGSSKADRLGTIVDTCGTGGSGINTFNISTAAAFVAAGCGIRIAKHGNRSASSSSGSADVLEALGVKIDVSADVVGKCIREVGIGFMFAPLFHSAMKYAACPRKEIGGRTIFNILGPLSNPAGARNQVLGVYEESLTETMANVLKKLSSRRLLVVHGMDGLDEITITDRTKITELDEDGTIRTYYISPEKFGMKRAGLEAIKGADAKKNARILLSVLKGERTARRDVVLLNAAAALAVGGMAKDFKDGIELARLSIDSGKALLKLNSLIAMTGKK